jgi:hypothetical protein
MLVPFGLGEIRELNTFFEAWEAQWQPLGISTVNAEVVELATDLIAFETER